MIWCVLWWSCRPLWDQRLVSDIPCQSAKGQMQYVSTENDLHLPAFYGSQKTAIFSTGGQFEKKQTAMFHSKL